MRPSDGNAVPRRSVFEKLLVKKWEYSVPRFFLGLRLAIGVILDAVGILLLPHTHLASIDQPPVVSARRRREWRRAALLMVAQV